MKNRVAESAVNICDPTLVAGDIVLNSTDAEHTRVRIEAELQRATTAMREACARKVRAFRDASYWSDVNHAALSKLADDIDSLVLEYAESRRLKPKDVRK